MKTILIFILFSITLLLSTCRKRDSFTDLLPDHPEYIGEWNKDRAGQGCTFVIYIDSTGNGIYRLIASSQECTKGVSPIYQACGGSKSNPGQKVKISETQITVECQTFRIKKKPTVVGTTVVNGMTLNNWEMVLTIERGLRKDVDFEFRITK
jgi:hypothetical protein